MLPKNVAGLGAPGAPRWPCGPRPSSFDWNRGRGPGKQPSPGCGARRPQAAGRDARNARRAVHIDDVRPQEGVQFGYALNLSMCIGCRKCAEACLHENNHDRRTNNSYIRVLEMEEGSFDMERGRTDYDHAVPAPGKFYMPVQCHQCDDAPCVKVCPVEATWKERDRIVVVDCNWCIGCRYCEAACPYHARRFNWRAPEIPPDEINPDQAYLSNRIRPQGVMEK